MEAVYSSDLSDEQWQALSRLIPSAKAGGRPRTVNMRAVLNALFYLARTGCAWRMLPKDYPPKDTVYYYFKRFRQDGTWERIHDLMRQRVRLKHGKQRQPSAAIIDSQSVKTTEKRGLVAATTPVKR
jgi:putative transposase